MPRSDREKEELPGGQGWQDTVGRGTVWKTQRRDRTWHIKKIASGLTCSLGCHWAFVGKRCTDITGCLALWIQLKSSSQVLVDFSDGVLVLY